MEPCQTCRGQGEIIDRPCETCSGSGNIRSYKKINIEIPKGVEDGMTLQLRGEGEPFENGQPGDLLIRIHVKPHSVFERLADGQALIRQLNKKFKNILTQDL